MSHRITYRPNTDGSFTLVYKGDAQSLVDACAAEARAHRERGRQVNGDMRRVMSIDQVVLMDIAKKHGLSPFDPRVFEIAKGRDYSKFRTVDDRRYFRGR